MDTLHTQTEATIGEELVEFFHLNGHMVVEEILTADELQEYRALYDRFLSGEINCWQALDDALLENSCIWYAPGIHRRGIQPHRRAGAGGGALKCDCTEDEGIAAPVRAGSCLSHNGATLHHSRGNRTAQHRRPFILDYRPVATIACKREQGFDHGSTTIDGQIRNQEART